MCLAIAPCLCSPQGRQQFHDMLRLRKVGIVEALSPTVPIVAAIDLRSSVEVELNIDDRIQIAPEGPFVLSRNDVMYMFRNFPCLASSANHALSGLIVNILLSNETCRVEASWKNHYYLHS